MAASTITKSGSSITIANYNPNGAPATNAVTYTNPTGVLVKVDGTVVTIDIADYPARIFDQSVSSKQIAVLNGVDTTAYTAAQMQTALIASFSSGFSGNGGLVIQSGVILNIATSATGANFVLFADTPCTSLDIVNLSGTDIEYRRNGAGSTMFIADQSGRMVEGITNANQIGIRRIDVVGTPVTLTAEAITA